MLPEICSAVGVTESPPPPMGPVADIWMRSQHFGPGCFPDPISCNWPRTTVWVTPPVLAIIPAENRIWVAVVYANGVNDWQRYHPGNWQ